MKNKKKITFTFEGKKYNVQTRELDTDSNYNMGISIHEKNNPKVPLWGTVIKHTDNISDVVERVINTWKKSSIMVEKIEGLG